MAHRRPLRRQVEKAMDFPSGTLADLSILEIEGDRRMVISGCLGIITYADDCIGLRVPEGQSTVFGQHLEMGCLTAEGATVTGRFQRIEFGACEGS